MYKKTDLAQYMLECEAIYWKKEAKKHGRGWWNARKDAIEKKRGRDALERLLEIMNGKD